MKKLFALLLTLVATVSAMFADIDSGTCGPNISWTFNDETGYLSITGSGKMNPDPDDHLWGDYAKTIYISEGITSICDAAFSGSNHLKRISIPNSVTSIGNYALSSCDSLPSITLPENLTIIGEGAFWGDSALTSITIPNSVVTIGDEAFAYCTGLTEIVLPNAITKLGPIFKYCTEITDVVIPNSVEELDDTFYECPKITSITMGSSVKYISGDAFNLARNVTNIIWYSNYFGGGPWGYGESLTSVTFGEGVDSIPYALCSNKPLLSSVDISNTVTSIGGFAFSNCPALTSIAIPNSVTKIGSAAFKDCSNLSSITLSSSLEKISGRLFENCTGLTSITIPSSVKEIEREAFKNCTGLTAVHINDLAAWCNVSIYWHYLATPLYYAHHLYCNNDEIIDLIIPDGVACINNYAFSNCSFIRSVTIPESVTRINEGAFMDCNGLKTVSIPNSVTEIGSYAFSNCWELQKIDLPNTITTIMPYAFSNCASLRSVEIPNSVVDILGHAFSICISMDSVFIPSSVEYIADYAFSECYKLRYIKNDASIPQLIEESVFEEVNKSICLLDVSLESIDLYKSSNVWKDFLFKDDPYICIADFGKCGENLGWRLSCDSTCLDIVGNGDMYAFNSWSNPNPWSKYSDKVEIINLPEGLTSISNNAFMDFAKVEKIVIPANVDTIGEYAFSWCANLKSVSLGGNVKYIGQAAFNACKNLPSIAIPQSLSRIEPYTFLNCYALTSVEIPNKISSIGTCAFGTCNNLKKVTCLASNPPQMGESVFINLDCSQIALYVQKNSVDKYISADQWKEFNPILPIGATATETTVVEATPAENGSVVVAWPAEDEAYTYVVEIREEDDMQPVCSLIFDAQGVLATFNAPARDNNHPSRVATQTATGWEYTLIGLKIEIKYTCTVTARNENNEALYTQSVSFEIEVAEGSVNVFYEEGKTSKHLRDGQVLIQRDNKTYTVTGQEVR